MAQTDLKSDAFCVYNQSTSPFFWVMEPGQYKNTYAFGEVGINATGGTAGSYIRPDLIDISSFLSGRDDMLSKCQPPIPDLDEIQQAPLKMQNDDAINLIPNYTREKRSAIDISAIDYNRWQLLNTEAQNPRFVIEDMWAQRGGLDSRNYTKKAWNTQACSSNLNPNQYCGPKCSPTTGSRVQSTMLNIPKPPQEPDYPFQGPYSQNVVSVGAAACGPNYFYGPNFDQGNCPDQQLSVLPNEALGLDKFPIVPQ